LPRVTSFWQQITAGWRCPRIRGKPNLAEAIRHAIVVGSVLRTFPDLGSADRLSSRLLVVVGSGVESEAIVATTFVHPSIEHEHEYEYEHESV
jgi:hypothetical protein